AEVAPTIPEPDIPEVAQIDEQEAEEYTEEPVVNDEGEHTVDIEIEVQAEIVEEGLTDTEPLIAPLYTQDYFLQQGEKVSEDIPEDIETLIAPEDDADKSLMVMMSFSEWLVHFKNTSEKQQE